MTFPRRAVPLAAALVAATLPAAAQNLRIALSSEPTAVDPHYHVLAPNNALAAHIFDSLVDTDDAQRLVPSLATAWKNDGANKWTFTLRKGVKFSNGKPFTADDVVFTFCRVAKNETNIASGNKDLMRSFKSVEAPDPYTLVVTTAEPEPLLPRLLAGISLLTSSITAHGRIAFNLDANCGVTGPWPSVSQFNEGSVAIGTGPYKLKSYVRGSAIDLERHDGYWGEKPHWATVKMVPVTNAGPRLAGLIAGDYDLIENPAARDLQRIREDKRLAFSAVPSSRVIFFQMDVARSPSPFVNEGKGANPLQDARVRKAIVLAVDREAIVKRLMDGGAVVANQFLPNGMYGTLANPPAIKFDPAAAKKLLAEAGYANGFDLTLTATNDRYINDGQIAQAVAGYLSQVGIRTKVDAMTRAIYFPRRAKKEFSFSMGGWGSAEASSFLRYWATAPDEKKTRGTSNYGGLADPQLDGLVAKALVTMDDDKRAELLRQSITRLLELNAFLPLHFESTLWAFKADIAYAGRADQYTFAMNAKPAKK